MEFWTTFILLLLVISLSDAEEKKNLKGIKGGNIVLPDPVLDRGFLYFGGKIIALVKKREFDIEENIYINRIQWNKSSGRFTLTNLQKNDSGIYNIDSKEGKVFFITYNLTVYDSVAPPAVQTLNVSSDSCYLLCAVDEAAEITLWWYKDQEVVNQSSSAGSLPLTVTKQDLSSSYRCVAGNPAENQTVAVDVKKLCRGIETNSSSENNQRHDWIIGVCTGFSALAVTVTALLIWWKRSKKNEWRAAERQDPEGIKSDVDYAEVNFCPNRSSQRGNLSDSPEPVDRSNLTTVYDKLEAHRMNLTDSDGNI